MNAISYSLSAIPDSIASGKKLYTAHVQTNGTLELEEIVADLAATTGQPKALVLYFLTSLNDMLEQKILAGYRINLGRLSTAFAIRGSFASEDEKFDRRKHTLVPTLRTLDPLRSALNAIEPENVTLGLTCKVISLMDFVTKGLNEITGSHELHLQGDNLGVDTENPDEFVALMDDDGHVVATATVTASDVQTITCKFETPPEPGVYTLVVSCRNGARVSLAPAISKLKNITVKEG